MYARVTTWIYTTLFTYVLKILSFLLVLTRAKY